jgi:hypothetical protein
VRLQHLGERPVLGGQRQGEIVANAVLERVLSREDRDVRGTRERQAGKKRWRIPELG